MKAGIELARSYMTLAQYMAKRSLTSRLKNRLHRDAKRIYWLLAPSPAESRKVLFILGSQRSGTSMLLQMFDNDWRTRTYKEVSSITQEAPRQIRLKPLTEVSDLFRKVREPLIVCKPLVESQRTRELLTYFDGSQALWAYRDYRDVINSNVNVFHSQVESCRIMAQGVSGNWRSEIVPAAALRLVQTYYHDSMSQKDAAALLWYARNCLFFEQRLQAIPAVRLWNYDDFVMNPENNAHDIYTWLGMMPPKPRAMRFVNPKSVGLGQNVSLSEEIEVACRALLDRLNGHYYELLAERGRPLLSI